MEEDAPPPRKKKSSVYVYTRFPEINDNEDEEEGENDEKDLDLKGTPHHRRTQYLGAIAANMGALALGTVLSWPAVALPSLRKDPEMMGNMTIDQESWIGSIVSLGAVAAGPVGGYAIEVLGRKRSMLFLSLPFFFGWILIHFANSIFLILVGRFITGFFAGTFAVAAPIFTAEVTDAGIRGAVGSAFDMMISLGILFIYVVGTFVTWRAQALICSIIPVIIFLLMTFVPESPVYLVKKGRMVEGLESLMKYRGASRALQVKSEFEDIVSEAVGIRQAWLPGIDGIRSLAVPWIILPVFIGFSIYTFQVISGLDPVLIYTVDIFHMAGAELDDYLSTIIIGTLQTLAGVVAASVVDRCGRRFLLLVSEALMVIALTLLGLYFHLKSQNGGVMPPGLGWLPVTSLAIYVLSYSVGLGPVGYTLMGEILPLQVKGLAGCILTSTKWFMSFIVTKFFQDLLNSLGHAGCFWLFAVMCALGFFFVLTMVPETKGRSLEDIQREFRAKFAVLENNLESVEEGEREPLISPVSRIPTTNTKRPVASSSSQVGQHNYATIVKD